MMAVKVQAENPVQAALVAAQVAGQHGADKFIVRDANGSENHVDLGLMHGLGLLTSKEAVASKEEMSATTEAGEPVEVEEVTE